MKKYSGFIATVIISMFFIACGDNKGNSGNNNNNNQNGNMPTISMSQSNVKAYVGDVKTIPVTAQYTDFTVTASPSGSGCAKSANNAAVTCTPTASGTYTVTVTATADTTKRVTATVTVPELEIFNGGKQTLYADEAEGLSITFNAAGNWTATAADDYGDAPSWLSLSTVSGLAGFIEDDSDLEALGGSPACLKDCGQDVSVHGEAGNFNISSEDYLTDGQLELHDVQTAAAIIGPSGNNTIKVTLLKPNDSMANRTATITIATSSGQITATIIQRYVTSDGNPYMPGGSSDITISMSPPSANTIVGTQMTFVVATQNTDFTMSVSPASGSGCAKSGGNVVCTPTAAGTYTVTLTATADTSKKATATLTATTAQPQNRTVTFYIDGTLSTVLQVENGASLGANMPANPGKTGYTFVGWNTNQSATSANFTAATAVTSNTTVYAIWQAVYRTVTFNVDGGVYATRQIQSGSSLVSNMPPNPTKPGYDFVGWNTNSPSANANFYSTTPITENVTVYVVWQAVVPDSRAVTFYIDGALSTVAHVANGSSLGSNMPANPAKTCYDFVGWNTNSSAASGNFTATTAVTADTTVHAIWQIKTYTTSNIYMFILDSIKFGSRPLSYMEILFSPTSRSI